MKISPLRTSRYTPAMRTCSKPCTSIARRGHGALILVVLIAMAIILVLMFSGFGGGSYMQQQTTARKQGREMAHTLNTRQLTMLISMYRDQHGRLPKNAAELDNASAFRDQWGNPITFTFEQNPAGQTTVVYRSPGPDGESGTPDDIEHRDTLH